MASRENKLPFSRKYLKTNNDGKSGAIVMLNSHLPPISKLQQNLKVLDMYIHRGLPSSSTMHEEMK